MLIGLACQLKNPENKRQEPLKHWWFGLIFFPFLRGLSQVQNVSFLGCKFRKPSFCPFGLASTKHCATSIALLLKWNELIYQTPAQLALDYHGTTGTNIHLGNLLYINPFNLNVSAILGKNSQNQSASFGVTNRKVRVSLVVRFRCINDVRKIITTY